MEIPFIDLKTQQQRVLPEIEKRIQAVLKHGQYILGPEIQELEQRLADFVQVKHAITCSSGTDALLMPLMAMGIGPGDAVFTTPFTFIATAEVISLLGATPIFVDIDPRTFNLDPAKLEAAIQALKKNDPGLYPLPSVLSPRSSRLIPKAIIPVDLFGLPADYDPIMKIAGQHGLFVLEDAAQSFGALYKGKKAGSLAHAAATSFFPAKPLGCYGDGGAAFTDDDELAEKLLSIRVHGKGGNKYDNIRIGLNARMDTLQAAILLPKLDIFPEEIEARQCIAKQYTELLSAFSPALSTPDVPEGYKSVWAQYSLLSDQQTEIQKSLKEAGIPSVVYYPKPLHQQAAFKNLGYRVGNFPVSEMTSKKIFSLPMHPYLTKEQIIQIASVVISEEKQNVSLHSFL